MDLMKGLSGSFLFFAMKSHFDLMISFRTPDGYKVCRQYFLGYDRQFAEQVFGSLKGIPVNEGESMLHLDLMETNDGLLVKVKSLGCKLSELCGNCQLVTTELFRLHAIDPGKQKA